MMPPSPCRKCRRRRPPLSTATVAVIVVLSSLIFAATGASAFVPAAPRSASAPLRRGALSASSRDDGEVNTEEEDWRAFRARLVQDGLRLGVPSATNENTRYAHELAQNIEVGSVLVSIPTSDLCQALEQQYWHRSVVLITDVSKDRINGDEECVPDEQLAQGEGRGRWRYRGVLLNRLTDLAFDERGEQTTARRGDNADDEKHWRIFRGGDLAGLDASDGQTEFICLHSLPQTEVREVSNQLVGNICTIPLDQAQRCCAVLPSQCSPQDFWTFGGYCSWRPGQLEREMGEGRGEWIAASVDATTIVDELSRVAGALDARGEENDKFAHRVLEAGTIQWRSFLGMIGRTESRATERIPAGQLRFYDEMLKVWAEECLSVDDNEGGSNVKESSGDSEPYRNSRALIGPGTVVRASVDVPNDILLLDQECIKSLILVLEDTSEATVGVILNHPLAAAVECLEDAPPLPLRYGGPIDVQDWKAGESESEFDEVGDEDEVYEGFLDFEYQPGFGFGDDKVDSDSGYDVEDVEGEEEEDSPFIWLHRDAALGSQSPDGTGGTQLGTSGVWLISETEALTALQSKELNLDDVMVFAGVCIWEKGPDLGTVGGGIREQIDAFESLDIIQGCNERSDGVLTQLIWDILSQQQDVLSEETFDANIDASIEAWAAAESKNRRMGGDSSPKVGNSEALSDAALRAWVAVNLLGDPLGTLVEVKEQKQGRKIKGQ